MCVCVCVRLEQYQCLQLQWRTESVQYLVVSVWEDVFKKRNMTENHNDRSASTDRHKHTHTHISQNTVKEKIVPGKHRRTGWVSSGTWLTAVCCSWEEKHNIQRTSLRYNEQCGLLMLLHFYFFICAGLHLYACVSVCVCMHFVFELW